MRGAFPYCSSMRLLHMCQRASVQVQPPLWNRILKFHVQRRWPFPPTPVLGLTFGSWTQHAPLRAAAMLNHTESVYLRDGYTERVKDGEHVLPLEDTRVPLRDVMLLYWHVKYGSLIGRQLGVKIIYVETCSGQQFNLHHTMGWHSNSTDGHVTLSLNLQNLEPPQRPQEPP